MIDDKHRFQVLLFRRHEAQERCHQELVAAGHWEKRKYVFFDHVPKERFRHHTHEAAIWAKVYEIYDCLTWGLRSIHSPN